jgi:LacI family transcriptional regulator
MAITLKDIADELNISVNAVSRALRNLPDIGEKTTKLVHETAQRMGYRKNLAASCLKTAKSMTVGVVIPDICNPVFSYMYKGVESYCADMNYTLMLGNSNENSITENAVLENMIARSVDGVIIVPCDKNKSYKNMLENVGIPYIALQRAPEEESNLVQTSDFEGGYLAAKHLYELGHRSFVLIFAPMSISSSQDRYNGFVSFLAENGLLKDCVKTIECDGTRDGGYDAMKHWIARHKDSLPASAIFCFSDYIACGVYSAISESGLRIPDDISIIGYDNNEYCDILNPPLTTIDMRPFRIGERAAVMMIKLLNEKSGENTVEKKIISPKLVIRNSVKSI